MRGRLIPILILLGVAVIEGCTGVAGPPQSPISDVVRASYAWFDAINARDLSAATAFFQPSDRGQMDWNGGRTADWPSFADVVCKRLTARGADEKDVYCTFKESGPPGTQLDDFWTINFGRQANGGWLITGYGTP